MNPVNEPWIPDTKNKKAWLWSHVSVSTLYNGSCRRYTIEAVGAQSQQSPNNAQFIVFPARGGGSPNRRGATPTAAIPSATSPTSLGIGGGYTRLSCTHLTHPST